MKTAIIDHSKEKIQDALGIDDSFSEPLLRKIFYRLITSTEEEHDHYAISNSLQDIATAIKLRNGATEEEAKTLTIHDLELVFMGFTWGKIYQIHREEQDKKMEILEDFLHKELKDSLSAFLKGFGK